MLPAKPRIQTHIGPEKQARAVLLNDRCLLARSGGIPNYLRALIAHWPANADLALQGLCDVHRTKNRDREARTARNPPPIARDLPFVSLRELVARHGSSARLLPRIRSILRRPARALYRRAFRSEARSPRYAAAFEPNHLTIPSECPAVATFHDLSVIERPQWHEPANVRHWEASLPASIAATSHFVADSAFTRGRMMQLLGIRGERITVAPLAPCLVAASAGKVSAPIHGAGSPGRYLLHLGTIEPRKNLTTILDAYLSLPAAMRDECPLVFGGAPGWGSAEFWRRLAEHPAADRVRCAGFLSAATAWRLLAGATALLFPSRYEGFGLPLVEAMAAGVPAIASDIEVFHEIAAQAVLYALPSEADAWAAQITRLLGEPQLSASLVEAGRTRALYFSWERTATTTLAVLREAAGT